MRLLHPGEGGTHFRQFDENEIAELFSGVAGNANGGDIAFELQPFVFCSKFQHRVLSGDGMKLSFVGGLYEGQGGDGDGQIFAAHFREDRRAGSGVRNRHVTHGDGAFDRRTETARGHFADFRLAFSIREKLRVATHRCLALGLQADAAARCAVLQFTKNAFRARETAFAITAGAARLLDRPFQRCFDGEVVVSMSLP